MAVPDYQSIMLPLLRFAGDGGEHNISQAVEELALRFKLADDDRKEMLPSGLQARFDNRVGWARTYLKKAGLLETVRRGTFRITPRGLDVLKTNPAEINAKFLTKFPEFGEFINLSNQDSMQEGETKLEQTPQEALESSYQNLRRELAQELLVLMRKCPPRFFEKLVVDVLVGMGYGGSRKDAGQAVGQSGDGGIDGIIKEDKLGLDVVYVQAKRWDAPVGRPVVQAFSGSLDGQKARKGVLITTSRFSQDAQAYVDRIEKRIVLIDGEQLAQLMIDHGVGVTEISTYVVKKADLDYFADE